MLQLHYVLQLTAIMAHWILILVFQTLKCRYFPSVPRYCKDKYRKRDLNVYSESVTWPGLWRFVSIWSTTLYIRSDPSSRKLGVVMCSFEEAGVGGLVPLGDITSHATFFFSAWLNFIPITVIRIFLHISFSLQCRLYVRCWRINEAKGTIFRKK